MSGKPEEDTTLSGRRFSASNEESRRAEQERLWALTPLQRMALALRLGRETRGNGSGEWRFEEVSQDSILQSALALTEDVLDVLRAHQLDAVVIGAMALAAHGYPRGTHDLDLAVAMDPRLLHTIAAELRSKGHQVEVRDPDPADPLGGVMDVRGASDQLVQVVNFLNPPGGGFPRLVLDSFEGAREIAPTSPIRVVDLYHLIAFKLYAGGPKSKLDILELLDRNPSLDRPRLTALCETYRLSEELDAVLALEGKALGGKVS